MSIRVECACGETLYALDVFAGGQIKCDACESMVSIPDTAPVAESEKKIKFSCPHCSTRVIGRKASIGKRSKCPSCGETYVIPKPPPVPEPAHVGKTARFDIDVDDVTFSQEMIEELKHRPSIPLDEVRLAPIGRIQNPKPSQMPDSKPTTPVPAPNSSYPIPMPQQAPAVPPATAPIHITPPHQPPVVPQPPAATPQPQYPSLQPLSPVPQTNSPLHQPQWSDPGTNIVELRVTGGEFHGEAIRLNVRNFLVGRERDCHLRLNSKSVSHHHFVLKSDDFSVRIRDLGSGKGTYVNGLKCEGEIVLAHGDSIRVGDFKIRLVLPKAMANGQIPVEAIPSMDDFIVY